MFVGAVLAGLLALAAANPIKDVDEELTKIGVDVDKLHTVFSALGEQAKQQLGDEAEEAEKLEAEYDKTHEGEEKKSNDDDISKVNEKAGAETELMEGDILLSKEQVDALASSEDPRERRQALKDVTKRWKEENGRPTIPYSFEASFPADFQKVVLAGMNYWQQKTCIRFRPATANDKSKIKVFLGNGCYAQLGSTGREEWLSIGNGCQWLNTVCHELAHTFGIHHMQTRADRDRYIYVDLNNVQKSMQYNFAQDPTNFDIYDQPYELGSIMQYTKSAFAVDYSKTSMVARAPNQHLQDSFNNPMPTFYDIQLVNKLYCTKTCPTKISCRNNGVQDVNNCAKCLCPTSYGGQYCEGLAPNTKVYTLPATGNQTITFSLGSTSKQRTPAFEESIAVLQAPAGRSIKTTITTTSGLMGQDCVITGIELVVGADTRMAGQRFCDYSRPAVVTSNNNRVTLRAYNSQYLLSVTVVASVV